MSATGSHLGCFAEPGSPALWLRWADAAGLGALEAQVGQASAAWLAGVGFTGKPQQIVLVPGPDGPPAGAVLGVASSHSLSPWCFGGLPHGLPEGSTWRIAPDFGETPEARSALALGWGLGAYRFTRFRPAGRAPARLIPPIGTEEPLIAAEAAWRVRDLINTPASHLGPAELAAAVIGLAQAHGAEASVIEGRALTEGFPALAMVGAASARAPRVAILEWGRTDAPLVALCGKGVCFDTGGLDLKPSAAMLRMKKDMAGAAAVLGAAEMVMRLRLPVRLLVLVGAVENAVGGSAFRPGDVLATRAGLSVEVGNTDAEGRLVLADLLAFAAERNPALMIDCATLTGAARVALGPDIPALFTDDDSLAELLLGAGLDTHDPLWRLPMHAAYGSWLDSQVADLNNVSSRPMAGATIGALFLKRFVPMGMPWAHIDLYAWNDTSRPGRPEGGEAHAVRALARLIARRFGGATRA